MTERMNSLLQAVRRVVTSLLVASTGFSTLAIAYDFEKVEQAVAALTPSTQRGWEQKAQEGDRIAQNVTGMAYKYGIGVAQDHAVSVKWFHAAAEQGEADAQFNLGRLYESDAEGFYRGARGAPPDDVAAVRWYRLSAEQGHRQAQRKLASKLLAADVSGVERDPVEAYKWLLIASASGDPTAAETMRSARTTMSEQEVERGEWLARQWRAIQPVR